MAKKNKFKLGQLCKFRNSYVLIVEMYRKDSSKGEACYILFPKGFVGTVSAKSLEAI